MLECPTLSSKESLFENLNVLPKHLVRAESLLTLKVLAQISGKSYKRSKIVDCVTLKYSG